MTRHPSEEDGQLYTLGLFEGLRTECSELWGTSSELYYRIDRLLRELSNPNLHEILPASAFRVELWTDTTSTSDGSWRRPLQ